MAATGRDDRAVDTIRDRLREMKRGILRDVTGYLDQRIQHYLDTYDEDLRGLRPEHVREAARLDEKDPAWDDFTEASNARARSVVLPANEDDEIVELVVGEKLFITTPTTLLCCRRSKLAKVYASMKRYNKDAYRIFIDRDPTHFGKILQYFRDSHDSLVWLRNPKFGIAEIQEVRQEAIYYGLNNLVRILSWEILTRCPVVNVHDPSKLRAVYDRLMPSGRYGTVPILYQTIASVDWSNINLMGVKFRNISFHHPVQFNGSVLTGAVFKDCYFRATADFTDTYMVGAKFIHCHGSMPASRVFRYGGARGAECIPRRW